MAPASLHNSEKWDGTTEDEGVYQGERHTRQATSEPQKKNQVCRHGPPQSGKQTIAELPNLLRGTVRSEGEKGTRHVDS